MYIQLLGVEGSLLDFKRKVIRELSPPKSIYNVGISAGFDRAVSDITVNWGWKPNWKESTTIKLIVRNNDFMSLPLGAASGIRWIGAPNEEIIVRKNDDFGIDISPSTTNEIEILLVSDIGIGRHVGKIYISERIKINQAAVSIDVNVLDTAHVHLLEELLTR